MGFLESELDPVQVEQGRCKEPDQLVECGVFEKGPKTQAAEKLKLTSRWVDVQKEGFVRSRLVAREYSQDKRDDTFAATTTLSTSRLIDLKASKSFDS